MKYKKTEKEIIQALVKYEGKAVTIAPRYPSNISKGAMPCNR